MSLTRIQVQGPTLVHSNVNGRPWVPFNNATALSYINSIEPVFNFTALTTFNGGAAGRRGFRLWGTTDMPAEANGAAIISVIAESAGRRAGGGAGSNWRVSTRDGNTAAVDFNTRHFAPYNAGPLGFHIRFSTFTRDPNGNVWTSEYINGPDLQMGLFQDAAAATGCSVSYIDFEVLWGGASGAWVTVGISLLLPLLLPILGGMNLYHINDTELAQVQRIIKNTSKIVGEASYPSIVLPEEKEIVLKALSRPTYGV